MLVTKESYKIGIAVLRIGVGIIFLWAGLEKLMAPEPWSAAGFLDSGLLGPSAGPACPARRHRDGLQPDRGALASLAANDTSMTVINFLVPYGQLGIGIGLILGLLTRF